MEKFSHACLEFTYLIKLPGAHKYTAKKWNDWEESEKKKQKNIHKVTKSSEKEVDVSLYQVHC